LRPRAVEGGQICDEEVESTANAFVQTWRWKREHLSHAERFEKAYVFRCAGGGELMTFEQRAFREATGFASTVWDSSIVVSRYLEKTGLCSGCRVLELGAGCGLVSAVAATTGAAFVAATDLEENLPLLQRNLAQATTSSRERPTVAALRWGDAAAADALGGRFDLVLGCDIMYIDEQETVRDLLATLVQVTTESSVVLLAHGRNRFAEGRFLAEARAEFTVRDVPRADLHPKYQCEDVRVLKLQRRRALRSRKRRRSTDE